MTFFLEVILHTTIFYSKVNHHTVNNCSMEGVTAQCFLWPNSVDFFKKLKKSSV